MGKFAYIAAFDLDKTILGVNSSRVLVKTSKKMGYMNSRDFLQAIYYSIVYKFDLKDANKIVVSMLQWLKGVSETEVRNMILHHAIPDLIQTIRPEIINEVAEHRKNNAKVIILSSALEYICSPIAKHLKVDDLVCSKMEVKNDLFTGKAVGNLVFGKEKAVRMRTYCDQHKFPLDTAYYYGDAYTDHFVLDIVGNPVCVKPEIKLGNRARKKGWRII